MNIHFEVPILFIRSFMQVRFAPMQISNLSMASSPPMVWKPAQERYHHHQHCLRSLPGAHLHLSRMFSNAASNRQLLISYLRYHKWTWTEFSFLSEHGLGHLYAILKGQWLNVMYIVYTMSLIADIWEILNGLLFRGPHQTHFCSSVWCSTGIPEILYYEIFDIRLISNDTDPALWR